MAINKLDQFGRFYQSSLTSVMQLMQIKLADNDVADMVCRGVVRHDILFHCPTQI